MGKYRKLGINLIIISIGSFASKIISFLLVPLYTSILTTAEYGVSDLVTTSSNLVLPIISLSLYEAVTRFALEDKSDYNLKQLFSISSYVTFVGWLFFSFFSFAFLRKTALSDNIDLFIVYTFVMSNNLIINQLVRGREHLLDYAIAGVIHTITFIASNIFFLIVFRFGVRGYLWSYIVGYLVSSIYLVIRGKLLRFLITPKDLDFCVFRRMVRYAVPLIPNALSWWISNSSDKYIITAFCGTSTNGIYSIAYKIPTILTIFTALFYSAWQISSIEGFGTEETRKFYEDVNKKYTVLLLVIASSLIAFIKPIASLVFSNDFYQAWVFTPVLVMASVFSSLANFYGSIYSAASKTKILFISTIVAAGSNVLMNFILIPVWGAMGAAVATLISYIVIWYVRFVFSKKLLYMKIDWMRIGPTLLFIAFQIVILWSGHIINGFMEILILIIIVIINWRTIVELINIVLITVVKKAGADNDITR